MFSFQHHKFIITIIAEECHFVTGEQRDIGHIVFLNAPA